jgi:hypothetical protein
MVTSATAQLLSNMAIGALMSCAAGGSRRWCAAASGCQTREVVAPPGNQLGGAFLMTDAGGRAPAGVTHQCPAAAVKSFLASAECD